MATFTTNKYLYWIVGIVIVLIVVIGIPWVLGYRIQGGHVAAPGTVVITVPVAGATIFVDGVKKEQSSKDNQALSFSLTSAAHTILIGKEGYWPWKKELAIAAGQDIHLSPFMLSQTVSGSAIGSKDPEYAAILAQVKNNKVPDANTKKISKDGNVAIWYQNGAIYAEWVPASTQPEYFCASNGIGNCDKTLKVLPLGVAPSSISFYKDRSDVILIAVADSVSAVELDTRGTQNFEPLYKGGTPAFVEKDKSTSLYVFDGTSLMEIAE